MSLQILLAHTGERLSATPVHHGSLEAFKSWLADSTAVAPQNQILLTPNGKQAKFPALCSEPEIFLYNRQLISSSSSKAPLPTFTARSIANIPPPPELPPPSSINSLQAWRDAFDARRLWAVDVARKAAAMANEFSSHFAALEAIERGLSVAVGNLESHVRALEQRYQEARNWSEDAVQDQDQLMEAAQFTFDQLRFLPAVHSFKRFFLVFDSVDLRAPPQNLTLDTLAGDKFVSKALADVSRLRAALLDKVKKLGDSVDHVVSDASDLVAEVERYYTESVANLKSDASQLMEEINVAANKISSDCDHLKTLPVSDRSMQQALKMASAHTRERLPALQQFSTEMAAMLTHVVQQRNFSSSRAVKTMQRIASIEANFASVNSRVVDLDVPTEGAEALDAISLISQLPFVYGALLIEAVRRHEWAGKIKSESSVLAEDIAAYREEEDKRRRKWLKNVAHYVREELVLGSTLNLELKFKGEGQNWPNATRDDISTYLHSLRSLEGMEEVVEELSDTAKALDKPTRAQAKRSRTFKMGSISDAAGGQASLLLRDSDEVRALRETNSKLEDDLKGQKSRVRKLEDLLYKQGQAARTSSGNIFRVPGSTSPEPQPPSTTSPRSEEPLSRRASANFRRTSANWSSEEKSLARRIVTLEAELLDERQRRQELEKSRQARRDDSDRIKTQMEEAHSTKRDLLENMEAQQREFASERRLLDDEISNHKQKIEELEDELDRLLGSRDHEKAITDEKHRSVETELEQVRQELLARKEEDTEKEQDTIRTLQSIFATLEPDKVAPKHLADLLNIVDEAAERSSRHAKELAHAVSSANTEKGSLKTSLERQSSDLASFRSIIQTLEQEVVAVKGEAADQRAKSASLATELDDARGQLRELRTKFAEGETGSEALRKRLEEQAAKAGDMSTKLAQEKSHVNSLDMELTSLQTRHQKLVSMMNDAVERLEKRSDRGRELTGRLIQRNEELARLLESLGLSMTQKDGMLVIQRTSKLVNASTTLTDPGASITFQQAYDGTPDPACVSWMDSDSLEEEEARFRALIAKLDTFNMNTFSDAVVKLRRDVEWTGKKWKMEARNYRDKYHRAQGEGQEKIAYRSFKEGDLALFLPTRNQATRPWAAFNVGAPHYFLRERESHRLKSREWLVARISKVEERVVDLSRAMGDSLKGDGKSDGGVSMEDDNPFELSDGLRWYMLDAAEEKMGAPSTPGLGKSTVASAHVDAKGSIEKKKLPAGKDASAKLNKSLESRRSSSNSKRESISGVGGRDGSAETQSLFTTEPEVPGSASQAANTPTSRGLGIEVVTNTTTDEQAKAASLSPSKNFLSFLANSPPKAWFSGGPSDASGSSPTQRHERSIQQGGQAASSANLLPIPSPSKRTSDTGSPSRTRGMHQSFESQNKQQRPGGWESVWSMEVNSANNGKARKS